MKQNFIDQAETMLASPRSPDVQFTSGNTPGVIGSQEVYRYKKNVLYKSIYDMEKIKNILF